MKRGQKRKEEAGKGKGQRKKKQDTCDGMNLWETAVFTQTDRALGDSRPQPCRSGNCHHGGWGGGCVCEGLPDHPEGAFLRKCLEKTIS